MIPAVDPSIQEGYVNKFKNKLFGLLCEREKNGEWEKFIDTLLIEIYGMPEEYRGINYLTLWFKISSLKYLDYPHFRNTIFECMNLIGKVL